MYPWKINFKDYYAVLQVSPSASLEVIRASYKALMKLYHPDSLNKEIESEVYLKAQEINEAYEVLSKPSLREVYHQDFLEYSQREVKKGHLFSFQYLKSYEKDLLKREAELKKKQQALKVKKTTLTPYSITLEQYEALKDLAFEFDHSNRELHLNKIIEKVKKYTYPEIKAFLDLVLESYKLPLIHEAIILELILDCSFQEYKKIILKAFKFRHLYPKLFAYIEKFHLEEYFDKVKSSIEGISFFTKENIFLIVPTLSLFSVVLSSKEFALFKKSLKKELKKQEKTKIKESSKDYMKEYEKVRDLLT